MKPLERAIRIAETCVGLVVGVSLLGAGAYFLARVGRQWDEDRAVRAEDARRREALSA